MEIWGVGIGIGDYAHEGKKDRRVGSAAPMENLSYSLICEKHCVTVGRA